MKRMPVAIQWTPVVKTQLVAIKPRGKTPASKARHPLLLQRTQQMHPMRRMQPREKKERRMVGVRTQQRLKELVRLRRRMTMIKVAILMQQILRMDKHPMARMTVVRVTV